MYAKAWPLARCPIHSWISIDLRLLKALFLTSRINFCLRLKNGRTDLWMNCIRSCLLMPSTTPFEITESMKRFQRHFLRPKYQRCIVHQVRNTLKFVADKDRKLFAAYLKKIYHAPNVERAAEIRESVTEKWNPKYPNALKSWVVNWDAITPIFKFSADVRTIIYTTNAIESLNATYRKLNRQRIGYCTI